MAEKNNFNAVWIAAAGFVVLVLIGAVMLGIRIGRGGTSSATEETPPATEPAAVPTEEMAQPQERDCGTLSNDQSYPTSSPRMQWETYGESAATIPVSAEFGPAQRDGTLWECYSHSPTGAVFAGVALLASFSVGGEYGAAVDSPQAEAAFEEDQQKAAQSSFPTWRGFRIDEYADDSARVSYLAEDAGTEGVMTLSLRWDAGDDDWRLDMTRPLEYAEATGTDEFVTWEG